MVKIDSNPQHRARLGRNGFDMSMIRKFSSSPGMLLPVYYDFLLPGDKVKFGTEMFTRTQPLVTPALVQLTNHCDWFFVPINQLYQFFGDSQFGIQDFKTNLVPSSSSVRPVPVAKVGDFYAAFSADPDETGAKPVFGNFSYHADRLWSLLGYSERISTASVASSTQKVNILMLQAYQKIYYDVYRLSDREANVPSAYNKDAFYNGDLTVNSLALSSVLHFRPWKKDLFTNVQLKPLINGGDIGMLSDYDLAKVNDWLSNNSPNYLAVPTLQDDKTVSGINNQAGSLNVTAGGLRNALNNVVSTSNIRSMFAVEKLSEITRRAAKHYDAQVLAHFGYEVPTGISGEVYRLGSDSAVFQIGEIASTADTVTGSTGQPLGELAGKGVAYNKQNMKSFTAPCHGILMAIYSCVPEADYDDYGIDRIHTYQSREDFYQPEFDRLGMQPLFYYQRMAVFESPVTASAIVGWQYRYAELKQKFNISNLPYSLRNWTTIRSESPSATLNDFLIPPTFLNSVMSVQQTNDGEQDNDPLINMFQFHVYKTSVMSTYGLPNL